MKQNYIELEAITRLQTLPYEQFHTYDLTHKNTIWVDKVLQEINNYDRDYQEHIIKPTFINLEMDIKRDINPRLKEYLLLKAHVQCGYYTSCSRCLLPSYEQIEFQYDICFINSQFAQADEYKDEDSLLIENQEFDLYFYERQNILFYESFREQLIMQLPPYSLHAEDCKGLCSECGANLNLTTCSHVK